jgi:hypothetical protein
MTLCEFRFGNVYLRGNEVYLDAMTAWLDYSF